MLLEDWAVQAQLGFLQLQIGARLKWLKTPKAKRNGALVDDVEALLRPASEKPAKRK